MRRARGGTPREEMPPHTHAVRLCQPPLPCHDQGSGSWVKDFALDSSLERLEQPPMPVCGEETAPQHSPRWQQEHWAQAQSWGALGDHHQSTDGRAACLGMTHQPVPHSPPRAPASVQGLPSAMAFPRGWRTPGGAGRCVGQARHRATLALRVTGSFRQQTPQPFLGPLPAEPPHLGLSMPAWHEPSPRTAHAQPVPAERGKGSAKPRGAGVGGTLDLLPPPHAFLRAATISSPRRAAPPVNTATTSLPVSSFGGARRPSALAHSGTHPHPATAQTWGPTAGGFLSEQWDELEHLSLPAALSQSHLPHGSVWRSLGKPTAGPADSLRPTAPHGLRGGGQPSRTPTLAGRPVRSHTGSPSLVAPQPTCHLTAGTTRDAAGCEQQPWGGGTPWGASPSTSQGSTHQLDLQRETCSFCSATLGSPGWQRESPAWWGDASVCWEGWERAPVPGAAGGEEAWAAPAPRWAGAGSHGCHQRAVRDGSGHWYAADRRGLSRQRPPSVAVTELVRPDTPPASLQAVGG